MPRTTRKSPPSAKAQPWRAPGRHGENLAVQDFPTFLLERVASLARRKITKEYLDRWHMSMPEWRVLNIVARDSPTNFSAAAQLSTMDKAQISLTLRSIAARGWIAMPPNGSGRRAARAITITARGKGVIAKILPDARRAQMRLLERLSTAERRQFHALLSKVLAILTDEH